MINNRYWYPRGEHRPRGPAGETLIAEPAAFSRTTHITTFGARIEDNSHHMHKTSTTKETHDGDQDR